MRLIISGSRKGISEEYFLNVVRNHHWFRTFPLDDPESELLFGDAEDGVDKYALTYAQVNRLKYQTFPALWSVYGPTRAGVLRNREMAELGTHLLAIWNGSSTGTKNMIQEAIARGLAVQVFCPSKRRN